MIGPSTFSTLPEILRARSTERGDEEAFLFVAETTMGETRRSVTYRDLWLDATRFAEGLEQIAGTGLNGERVVVAVSRGESFVTAMFAVWCAGGIPVPSPASGRTRVGRARLAHILRDSAPILALVDPADAEAHPPEAGSVGAEGIGGPADAVVLTAPFACGAEDVSAPLSARVEEVALLQYTSGSTSDPKGVVLSHTNLLANLRLIMSRTGSSASTRMCAWLPLYHDMGLIGTVLHTVFAGGSSVLMPPSLFLKRPYRWLQLISEQRATATVAPNFGYQTCVDRVDDQRLAGCDLSAWDIALNGSEAVSPETMERFTERFARFGLRPTTMRPCYGIAEASLLVCCADPRYPYQVATAVADDLQRGLLTPSHGPTDNPAVQQVVSCGPVRDFDVAIVDSDTAGTLPDGRVGEVWLRGPSVAAGYWRVPVGAEPMFGATTQDGRHGFLRTGDLGLVHGGELHITGRLKDVLVVRGRNLHPHDLEREVRRAHPALHEAQAAVFTALGQDGVVVAIAELRQWARFEAGEIERMVESVRREVARQYEVRVAGMALVRPGQIPRTSSGKVQHARAKALYEHNQLDTIYEVMDRPLSRLRAVATQS